MGRLNRDSTPRVGIQAGTSVAAHFCGASCEHDGKVWAMPPLSITVCGADDGRQTAGSTTYCYSGVPGVLQTAWPAQVSELLYT